jgi:hypothetical protein
MIAGFGLRFVPLAVRVVAPNGNETDSKLSGIEPEFTKLTVTVPALLEKIASRIFICGLCE